MTIGLRSFENALKNNHRTMRIIMRVKYIWKE